MKWNFFFQSFKKGFLYFDIEFRHLRKVRLIKARVISPNSALFLKAEHNPLQRSYGKVQHPCDFFCFENIILASNQQEVSMQMLSNQVRVLVHLISTCLEFLCSGHYFISSSNQGWGVLFLFFIAYTLTRSQTTYPSVFDTGVLQEFRHQTILHLLSLDSPKKKYFLNHDRAYSLIYIFSKHLNQSN
jgi:hypothetical protein